MSEQKQEKRPKWFKIPVDFLIKIENKSDEDIGKALRKALILFFEGEEADPEELGPLAYSLYDDLRIEVIKSLRAYQKKVQDGMDAAEEAKRKARILPFPKFPDGDDSPF